MLSSNDISAQRAKLDSILDQFNLDETALLTVLARKILGGKLKHGPLDIKADPRDFLLEVFAEKKDAVCYGAMFEIGEEIARV